MSEYLNLAEFALNIKTLGPGRRIVIWVQGCWQRCPGCISPEFQPVYPANLIRVVDLADLLIRNRQDHAGLTISGGEPMLQAEGLLSLWQQLKLVIPHWNLILFSGYTKKQIENDMDASMYDLMESSDAFIGGPYMQSMPNTFGLYGSANQEIYFSKDSRFGAAEQSSIRNYPKTQQLYISKDSILIAGIPIRSH